MISNHFHLLVWVPHRPDGFDVPLETVVTRLERAFLGEEAMAMARKQLEFWARSGMESVIEEWRQKQIARMFSLTKFLKCLKLRFSRWYNRQSARKGLLRESRFTSMIMEEENSSSHGNYKQSGTPASPAKQARQHQKPLLLEGAGAQCGNQRQIQPCHREHHRQPHRQLAAVCPSGRGDAGIPVPGAQAAVQRQLRSFPGL